MRMVIVLDKLCLACVVGVSLYVGYKTGVAHERLRNFVGKTNFNID